MKDVPAFVEEDYMTARSNHISAINFELMEIKYFDGRIDKVTTEWKGAEQELRKHTEFGLQLKRGKDIVDDEVRQVIAGELDPLAKARKFMILSRAGTNGMKFTGSTANLESKKLLTKNTFKVLITDWKELKSKMRR